MEAVVLAGGFGTRLQSVVKDVPKPMAEVAGRPFLTYILDSLDKQGVQHVVLAVGYKRDIIINYFGQQYKNLKISYSIEEEPLMTGGAIRQALELCKGPNVMILNGDTFFDIDLKAMQTHHIKNKSTVTIAVKPMENFDRYGTVTFDNHGRIQAFLEKQPCEKGFINGGIYILDKDCLQPINEKAFMMEKDYLEKYFSSIPMYAFISEGYFIDIGIPADFARANEEFKKLKE